MSSDGGKDPSAIQIDDLDPIQRHRVREIAPRRHWVSETWQDRFWRVSENLCVGHNLR
jgi:hypothetical protein